MDFDWTDEQRSIRHEAAAFAERELWPGFARRDEARTFDRSLWTKLADYGLFKLAVPRAYGGKGRPLEELVLSLEGIGYGCPDLGLGLSVGAHLWGVIEPIVTFGDERQKTQFLPPLCDGRWIGAHNVTEWQTGTDINAIATTATETDDGWVINGTKSYVTNGPVADLHLVYCRLDVPDRKRLICLLVPPDTPGVRTRVLPTIGTRTAALGEVVFENCRLGRDATIGKPGAGALLFQAAMEKDRAVIFAPIVGAMQSPVELATEYAKQRTAFGRPIGSFQAVSHRIAEMAVRLDVSRLLLYRVACLKAKGSRAPLESSMAKLYISEALIQSSIDLIRTHGGSGYLQEQGIEHFLRDAVGGVLFSGTSDVQRNIIARQLGLG